MVVVLSQEAQRDRGHGIVAPGAIETAEQRAALLQNRAKNRICYQASLNITEAEIPLKLCPDALFCTNHATSAPTLKGTV